MVEIVEPLTREDKVKEAHPLNFVEIVEPLLIRKDKVKSSTKLDLHKVGCGNRERKSLQG